MKRVIISVAGGVVCTFGSFVLTGLVLYGSDAIIPFIVYWPLSITDKLGFRDCANANLISEKLTCMRMALLIDAFFYPLAIFVCSFVFHRVVFRRDRLRPSHVG